jgi:ribosomal protein S18 acetylase RimI-like enzyme
MQNRRVVQKLLAQADIREVGKLTSICNQYEALDYLTPDPQTHAVLYYQDGQLVGSVAFQLGIRKAELTIIVHPEKRRRGIGSTLLQAAKQECVRQGIQKCLLVCQETSKSGKAFLGSLGSRYQFSEYKMKLENRPSTIQVTGQPLRMYQASFKDRKLLASITAKSFSEPEEDRLQRYTHDITKPTHRFYIAALDNQPIGSIGVVSSNDRMWIVALGVLPEYRRRGYGRQMLTRIVRRLMKEGHREILIEAVTDNRNALTLYRTCGFKEQTEYGYYVVPI